MGSQSALAGVDQRQIEHRGKLPFIRGFSNGWNVAVKKQLPCLLFFTADWCTYCQQMEQTTFEDQAVANLAENFVCVLIDADHEKDVCQRFRVSGYPTIEFVSPSRGSIHRVVGRQSPSQLIHAMRVALDHVALLDADDSSTTR